MTLAKNEIFEGIKLIRPLLILCICIAHMPGVRGYSSSYDQYDQIDTLFAIFLKDFLARGGVPILTVISGYLAYFSYKKIPYGSLINKKFNTLLVPFLIWNVIALVFCFFSYSVFQVSYLNYSSLDGWKSYMNVILGVNLNMPINFPVYFIRDLFLIMAFLPVIDFLCRKKIVFSIFFIFWMFLSWVSHSIVFISDDFSTHILYRTDMLLYFFIGYFYALNGFPIPKLGRYGVFVVMVFLGVIGLFVSMYLSGVNPDGYDFVNIRFLFSMAFILAIPTFFSFITLNLNSVFVRVLRSLSPYSFTIFLSHIIFLNVFSFFVYRVLGWSVTERSSLFEQIPFVLFYLSSVCMFAFFVLKTWNVISNYLTGVVRSRVPKEYEQA